MSKNTKIRVCGKEFDTGVRVITWDEPDGLSFYSNAKLGYFPREMPLSQLRAIINAFYIHHSVSYTAKSTFNGLKARGLSVNFIIDDDINESGCATIYQALDVKDAAWSQGTPYNVTGSGVEICYMPDAWDHPDRYSEANVKKYNVQPRETKYDTIRGTKFKVFGPTDAQVEACIRLIVAYLKAFPDIKPEFPKNENGEFISGTAPSEKRIGLLHHFNITDRKMDAMGFPTNYVEEEIKKRLAKADTKSKIINTLKKIIGK